MIKYHVVERGEPGVTGGGTTKFYASLTDRETIDVKKLAYDIAKMSTVTAIDTRAVIESLIQLIPEYLKEGRQINLGEFGSFYLSAKSQGEATADDVTSSSITKLNVRFRPSARFKETFVGFKFKKVD